MVGRRRPSGAALVVGAALFYPLVFPKRKPPALDSCCPPPVDPGHDAPRLRRVLWIALALNIAMFGVEIAAGLTASSMSLLADAVDFFGDAVNYGLALMVLALAPAWRARTALLKGATMAGYGVFVLAQTAWEAAAGTVPEPVTMGVVAGLALLVNAAVALMLLGFRHGDANMRSVWLCSRNDVIGNMAVVAAALGVGGSGTGWPDFAVAAAMGVLALTAGAAVLRQARAELRGVPPTTQSADRRPVRG